MEKKLSPALYVLMYGGFLFIGILGGVTGPLVPFLRHDLNLSYTVAGLIFSAQSVGSLAVLLAGGWLIHAFGKRRLIFVGGALFAGGLLLTAFAPDYWWVLIGNFLLGAGIAF